MRSSALRARIRLADDNVRVTLSFPDDEVRVEWRALQGQIYPNADLLVPMCLPLAMRLGLSLEIEAPISRCLMRTSLDAQSLLTTWDPSMRPVRVEAEEEIDEQIDVTSPHGSDRSASFFSGGIDSFYTALTHRGELDDLIFVRGFDISRGRDMVLERAQASNQSAACELGLPLLILDTDVRDMSRRFLRWSEFHGAAMAAASHLVGRRRVWVPGSLSVGYTHQYGSHPALDPLFSSNRVEIIYDGFEVSRVDKTRLVSQSAIALRHLRVCNAGDDRDLNCSRCEKCLRTLIALRISCGPRRFPSFARPLILADVAARRPIHVKDLWVQNLYAANDEAHDVRLITALLTSLRE